MCCGALRNLGATVTMNSRLRSGGLRRFKKKLDIYRWLDLSPIVSVTKNVATTCVQQTSQARQSTQRALPSKKTILKTAKDNDTMIDRLHTPSSWNVEIGHFERKNVESDKFKNTGCEKSQRVACCQKSPEFSTYQKIYYLND